MSGGAMAVRQVYHNLFQGEKLGQVVFAHDELRLDLLDGLNNNGDDDKKRSAADDQVLRAGQLRNGQRQNGDDRKKDGADHQKCDW